MATALVNVPCAGANTTAGGPSTGIAYSAARVPRPSTKKIRSFTQPVRKGDSAAVDAARGRQAAHVSQGAPVRSVARLRFGGRGSGDGTDAPALDLHFQ